MNQQQPNNTGTPGAVPIPTATNRAPLSTAGYSIQESRRRMLETIDRRRNEMLNASNAAAAAVRGPQIGNVGSAGAMPMPMSMPRMQAASASASLSAFHRSSEQPTSSISTPVSHPGFRKNGFVSTVQTPNGGSFTHMKIPSMQQQHQQPATASYRGSLASVPAGALRFHNSSVSAGPPPQNSAFNNGNPAAGFGVRRRVAPPHAVMQADADSSVDASPAARPVSQLNGLPHHHQQQPPAQLPMRQTQAQMAHILEITPQPHPFFDQLELVLPPTALVPNRVNNRQLTAELTFSLSRQQAEMVAISRYRRQAGAVGQRSATEYGVQVLLRCFKIGSGPQSDSFPPGVALAVNANQVTSLPPPLPVCRPNSVPQRPGRPVNISGHCRISHAVLNRLTVSWLQTQPQAAAPTGYCVTVALARALTAQQLTERLQQLSPIGADVTRSKIIDMLAGGGGADEVSLTDLTASLRCPLTRSRIGIPARGLACSHLQCFDAAAFLSMNERKSRWRCPCCDRVLTVADLRVDQLFSNILADRAAAEPVDTVRFLPDGGWVPADSELSAGAASAPVDPSGKLVAAVDLTDDAPAPAPVPPLLPPVAAAAAQTVPQAVPLANHKRPPARTAAESCVGPDGILVITLSDSDDDEDSSDEARPPPAKRSNRPESTSASNSNYVGDAAVDSPANRAGNSASPGSATRSGCLGAANPPTLTQGIPTVGIPNYGNPVLGTPFHVNSAAFGGTGSGNRLRGIPSRQGDGNSGSVNPHRGIPSHQGDGNSGSVNPLRGIPSPQGDGNSGSVNPLRGILSPQGDGNSGSGNPHRGFPSQQGDGNSGSGNPHRGIPSQQGDGNSGSVNPLRGIHSQQGDGNSGSGNPHRGFPSYQGDGNSGNANSSLGFPGYHGSGNQRDLIPLPQAFLQDQPRLSAMLTAASMQRPQQSGLPN